MRDPVISIRVDAGLYQRWQALESALPRGLRTWTARDWILRLISGLEEDVKRAELRGKVD
jgi:hypothetical protein